MGKLIFVEPGEPDALGFQPMGHPVDAPVEQGVEGDGNDCRHDDGAGRFLGQYAEAHAHRGEDEGKFADLRQCDRDGKGHAQRLAEELDHNEGGQRFADEDDPKRGEDEGPVADERGGVEQHPHGNEEEDGEGVAHGQGFRGGLRAEFGLADDHAAEEGAEGHGRAEEIGRAHSHAEGQDKDGEGEEIAGSGAGYVGEELGDDPLADHQREDHKGAEFQRRNGKDVPDAFGLSAAAHDGGQKHQQKDGEEVFHHQPAEGDVARRGVQRLVVGEDAGQDDRAGDGDGHAENSPG